MMNKDTHTKIFMNLMFKEIDFFRNEIVFEPTLEQHGRMVVFILYFSVIHTGIYSY